MTNDEVKDDLIELEHCNLVCLVSDDDYDDDDDGVEDDLIELEHCNLVCLVSDDDDIYIMMKCLSVCV